MCRHGYSVRAARKRVLALQPERSDVPSAESGSPSFLPVCVSGARVSDTRSPDLLAGVSLTLPDGTVVSIRRGSAGAVASFLKLYSGEDVPCSD